MPKINLPKEILERDIFRSLPSKEKEEYIGNLLNKILELNPEGITISQIKEATGLTYSTIWHHLEVLSCTAQCHKITRGNLDVYYPTGKLSHLNDYNTKKANYGLSTVENPHGRFVCLHEKTESRTGTHTVCRGISIPIELIDGLVRDLSKIRDQYAEGKTQNK